mmetsp:Transcript_15277/g.47890  ORF Transcript_15277/g.47890 Transcript_15277/m.47890 type:complete len:198 (-) Transcript_15277:65-658(-)
MAAVAEICEVLYSGTEAIFLACALALREQLQRVTDGSETAKATVRLGIERLISWIRLIFDSEFDKVELYVMRNVLRFPDGVPENFKRLLDELPSPVEAAPAVDEDVLDAELQVLVTELKRAIDENEALRFRDRAARAHVARVSPLFADDPDITARAEAAVASFAAWRQELDALRARSLELSQRLSADTDNPQATSPT